MVINGTHCNMDPLTTSPKALPSHHSLPSSSSRSSVSTASGPSRHVCPDCGRSYKAAETLNRHRKNHSDTTQYVCRVCSASFKRKDLLDRHSQIHIHGSSSANRNRSQRACTRCSRLKTRCDNLKPCTRCARGGHECTYAESRSRARTDRSMETSPSRTESSAGSVAMASDISVTADMTSDLSMDNCSTDLVDPWDGDRVWHESLWTQSFPWYPHLNPPQSTSPQAMPQTFPTPADEYNMTNWNQAFHPNTSENVAQQQSAQNAFLDDPVIQSAPWPQWHRQNEMTTDSSTVFDGQFVTRPIISSNLNAEMTSNSTLGESSRRPAAPHGDVAKAAQRQFAAELAHLVVNFDRLSNHPDARARFWEHYSKTAESIFMLRGLTPRGTHLFQYFIGIFCRHFHLRWPIRHRPDLESASLPPYLYLVIAVAGAAYAGKSCGPFHVVMMDALRQQITLSAVQRPLSDEQILPTIEALFIIQSLILYAGDRRAFPFIPQISEIVAVLGQRIRLFDDPGLSTDKQQLDLDNLYNKDSIYCQWEKTEIRRRLAIAFLRTGVFVSLLLGTRPLVSYDEINVRSPVPDTIWLGEGAEGEMALRAAIRNEDSHVLSSLVRMTLDWNEAIPNIRFDELESVLYGLQSHVWRFSQDPQLARRLATDYDIRSNHRDGDDDNSMDYARNMREDYARTIYALKKWKIAFTASAPTTLLPHERKSLLASNILYNISFMKLRADLPGLHRVAISCVRNEQPSREALVEAYRWARWPGAWVAVESACSIWTLITSELNRPELVRAEFNILSHIGLLHAAVILWVYAGACVGDDADDNIMDNDNDNNDAANNDTDDKHEDTAATVPNRPRSLDMFGGVEFLDLADGQQQQQQQQRLRLCRSNNPWIMQNIAALLNDIHSLHGTSYRNYYNTVEALAQKALPSI